MSGDGALNTGVPARSVGVARPVAGNNDSRADGGLDTVGEVARLCNLGSAKVIGVFYRVSACLFHGFHMDVLYLYCNVVQGFGLVIICLFLSPLIQR